MIKVSSSLTTAAMSHFPIRQLTGFSFLYLKIIMEGPELLLWLSFLFHHSHKRTRDQEARAQEGKRWSGSFLLSGSFTSSNKTWRGDPKKKQKQSSTAWPLGPDACGLCLSGHTASTNRSQLTGTPWLNESTCRLYARCNNLKEA